MNTILQFIGFAIIIFSGFTLWPVLQKWIALRSSATEAAGLLRQAEGFRIEKLGEIAQARNADKAKMRSIDTNVLKIIGAHKKEESRRIPAKNKLLQELDELKSTIGVSEQSISESTARIQMLGELKGKINTDSDAIHALGNRIQELKKNTLKIDEESVVLEKRIEQTKELKRNLEVSVASTENHMLSMQKTQERQRIRRQLLSEGIQVFEQITNTEFLNSYPVRGQRSGASSAEYAKVFRDGQVLFLNEKLLRWEPYGEIVEYKDQLRSLFVMYDGPFIVRGLFDRKPVVVLLPSDLALSYISP